MIYRSFSKRQLLAMTWWNRPGLRDHDGILCDGAVRSGKTVCLVVGFFLWSMTAFGGQTFALCGKTVGALRRNIIDHLNDWLGGIFQFRQFYSQNKLVVRRADGQENTYYLFGGRDESACQLIQGITLAGVLLDEAALMPRSFVEQACARCSVSGSRLWFSCNPEGPEHWLYREYIRQAQQKKLLHLHFAMADNPALPDEIKARYETLYTGIFYRRFILGQWCMAEGLVYDFDPGLHVKSPPSPGGRCYISVDYGTQNPFSAGLWQVCGGKAYRIREFYHSGRDTGRMLTDEEYHEKLVELAGDLPVEQVIIDPSAASLIAAIRHHGIFSVRKAKNEVLPGIRWVATLLKAGVLSISPQCKDTIREFGLYRWDESSQQDRVVKENDHAMDDIRYFCATVLRRDREIRNLTGGTEY